VATRAAGKVMDEEGDVPFTLDHDAHSAAKCSGVPS
jgi:hypothetical protein